MRWNAAVMEQMAIWREYYDETILPQGSMYEYIWGSCGFEPRSGAICGCARRRCKHPEERVFLRIAHLPRVQGSITVCGELMKIEKMVLLVGVLSGGIVASQAQNAVPTSSATAIGMDDARIVLLGQIDTGNPKSPRLGYPGTGIVVRFKGSSLALFLSCDSEKSALTVVVDHGAPTLQLLQKG